MFFGSISHEGECFLWPLDEEMRQALVDNEDWSIELAVFYSQLLDWPVVEESPERIVVQAPETGIQ